MNCWWGWASVLLQLLLLLLAQGKADSPEWLAAAFGSSAPVSCDLCLLLFAKSTCEACVQFHELLATTLPQATVVVVARDPNRVRYDRHAALLPRGWRLLPFDSPHADRLNAEHNVRAVPTLVVLDGRDGRVLDADGYFTVLARRSQAPDYWRGLRDGTVERAPRAAPHPGAADLLHKLQPAATPALKLTRALSLPPLAPQSFACLVHAYAALGRAVQQLDASGGVEAFQARWTSLARALATLRLLDLNGLFPLLDRITAGDEAERETLEGATHALARLGRLGEELHQVHDATLLARAWGAFRAAWQAFVEQRERVVAPLIRRTAGTPAGQARVFAWHVLNHRGGDFAHLVASVVEQLPSETAAHFLVGLRAASTREQWLEWLTAVQATAAGPPLVHAHGLDDLAPCLEAAGHSEL